jgi:hypothetical protein
VNGKICDLIEELPQASKQRVVDILTFTEGALSDVECNLPTEDDNDEAYACQNVSKANEIIESIRTLNVEGSAEGVASTSHMIIKLSAELNSVFHQI